MVENIINEMISLTDQKVEKLNAILSLKPKQKEAILKENMEDIKATIDGIQNQMNKINEIDSLYSQKFDELKLNACIEKISQLDDMAYYNAGVLKGKLKDIKSIIQSIMVIDDENKLLINEKHEEIKEKLRNLRQGKKMAKGYFSDYKGTMFIDERN